MSRSGNAVEQGIDKLGVGVFDVSVPAVFTPLIGVFSVIALDKSIGAVRVFWCSGSRGKALREVDAAEGQLDTGVVKVEVGQEAETFPSKDGKLEFFFPGNNTCAPKVAFRFG